MELRKLDYSYYDDNSHIQKALDGDGRGKTRGYGILVISILDQSGNPTKWGIPLHSNLQNKACFPLGTKEKPDGTETKTGLNYSKAILLTKESYVSDQVYLIPEDQKNAISKSERKITDDFEKYVKKYIKAATLNQQPVLGNKEYKHTTLVNYHTELGIEVVEPKITVKKKRSYTVPEQNS